MPLKRTKLSRAGGPAKVKSPNMRVAYKPNIANKAIAKPRPATPAYGSTPPRLGGSRNKLSPVKSPGTGEPRVPRQPGTKPVPRPPRKPIQKPGKPIKRPGKPGVPGPKPPTPPPGGWGTAEQQRAYATKLNQILREKGMANVNSSGPEGRARWAAREAFLKQYRTANPPPKMKPVAPTPMPGIRPDGPRVPRKPIRK